jgi:hypothetical protein
MNEKEEDGEVEWKGKENKCKLIEEEKSKIAWKEKRRNAEGRSLKTH